MSQSTTTDLDQILSLWAQSFTIKETMGSATEGCQHEAKLYVGFSEEYEFCIKCDAKLRDGVWFKAAQT